MFTRKSIFRTFSVLLVVLMMSGAVSARSLNRTSLAILARDLWMMSGAVSARSLNAALGTGARLTYQGRLTNSSGAPLNSPVNMVFKLYSSSSVLLWTSATRSVTPVNGLFTVYLGDSADPALHNDTLTSVTSIGVTVGSDPEMTPRQPLNSVVGHSDSEAGVAGSSNSDIGVVGFSNTGYGVLGYSQTGAGVVGSTSDPAGAGIFALGAGSSGTALVISNGGIRVAGAGINTTTPAFVHAVAAGNITAGNQTIITHPLTDNDPDAILIITPSYNYDLAGGVNNPHPVGVFYNSSFSRWVIYNIDNAAMLAGQQFNVLVVKP